MHTWNVFYLIWCHVVSYGSAEDIVTSLCYFFRVFKELHLGVVCFSFECCGEPTIVSVSVQAKWTSWKYCLPS